MGAGTYPRATRLSDGSVLGVYTAFDNGYTTLKTIKSIDGGLSWLALGEIAKAASNANDLDNPYVLQLPSGRILSAFRNHSRDPSTGKYTFYRISMSSSDDYGETWTYLSQPASESDIVNGIWEPFLRNAQDGSLQIYYSRENAANDQDTLERVSVDKGQTWSDASTISGVAITARDGMTGVATITGSSLIAVFESGADGVFTINSITSNDDGITWGNRQRVYTSPMTRNAAAPQVINVGGTLVVSFITDEDAGNPDVKEVNTSAENTSAKIVISEDQGATWGQKITIGEEPSFWPGLVDLDDKNFLMMFDNGGAAKSKRVTLHGN